MTNLKLNHQSGANNHHLSTNKYSMSLREILSILVGGKKPVLIPVPKNNGQKR
jgi:hypothetical protein